MQIELRTDFDCVEWQEIIRELDGGPFHLPDPLMVSHKAEELAYILLTDKGKVVGAAVGITLEKAYLKFIKVSKMLHLPTPPAVDGSSGITAASALKELAAFASSKGYKSLEVEPRWGEDFSSDEYLSKSLDRRLLEFTIDLGQDEEAILGAMHQKHRKNIRKSLSNGLEISRCSGLDDFLKLRDMQQSSSERASEKGNSYGIQDEGFYAESYKKVYGNGPGRLWLAKKDGEYVAALAWLEFGKKAVTVRSGATTLGYETSAMYLLQWELIRVLKEQGFRTLNIGGVPAEASLPGHQQRGLFNYKKYYGGPQRLRTGLRINL